MALRNTTFIRMRSNAGPFCSQYNISIHNKENMKYIILTVILMIMTLQCHAAESRFLRWGGTHNRNRNRRQGGQGQGEGGGGGGGGPGGNGLIPKLIENRDKISRSVVDYSDGDQHGVRTVTGAKNSVDNKDEINDWIYAHVQEMQQLLDNGGMIRGFDGLFQEIIENYDLLNLNCQQQQSSGKVVCTHTSDDCQGEKLARAHAEFVSLVLKDIDTKDKNNAYLIDEQKCSQSWRAS